MFKKIYQFIQIAVIVAMIINLSATGVAAGPIIQSQTDDLLAIEAPPQIAFFINGESVAFNADTGMPYINAAGRTMIPVRACLAAIGCFVDWESQARTVITKKGNVTVDIPVGENSITVNGSPVLIDTAAIISGGRTYLPLRAVLEAYGYAVSWDDSARSVYAIELTPANINGGTTGIFQRKQLPFSGFDGIRASITLPYVFNLEAGDCPYIYLGFDWNNSVENAECGFQFIDDPTHAHYNEWTLFLRQGNVWSWGRNIYIKQGETHRITFHAEYNSDGYIDLADLVAELDGEEAIRKKSTVDNFRNASVKTVIAMAMSKPFDGKDCLSKSIGAKIFNVEVRITGSEDYREFGDFSLYSSWRPDIGVAGMWFGSSNCVPAYIHYENDGGLSIYDSESTVFTE